MIANALPRKHARSGHGVTTLAMLAVGWLQAAALAWPWQSMGPTGQPVWWLQIVSLGLLCVALRHTESPRQAAWRAGSFALGWLAGTFWWLFISMHTYGGLPAPAAVLAVLALAAFLALYYAGAAWCWRRYLPQRGGAAVLTFAAMWTLAELARGTLWTGFPWGAGGYAHVEGPLAVLAPWAGVYGVGAMAAAWGMALALKARGPLLCLALIVAALWGVQTWLPSQNDADRPAVPVRLLQGNIPQDEKFVPGAGIPLALDWYAQELLKPFEGLVVAPETAIPLLPQQLPADYLDAIGRSYGVGSTRRAAMLGIPLGDPAVGFTNSAIALAGSNTAYRYDKHHLVPFGEFIPPLFAWFVRMMHIPLGDFNRGDVAQPSLQWAGERWAPNICYEDLFGEELGRRFVDPAQAPTVFVNLSNIGWFGDSVAVDQHLHISRMRSLEFARPTIRATNTGATAIIDAQGQVTHALAPHTRGVLHGQVQGAQNITFYARWVALWGLWPLGLACVVAVLAGVGLGRRVRASAR